MLYVALAQTLVVAALVAALVLRERDHDRDTAERDAREHAIRADLINRVTHPNIWQPATQPATVQNPDPPETDGFELAGRAADEMAGDFGRLVMSDDDG